MDGARPDVCLLRQVAVPVIPAFGDKGRGQRPVVFLQRHAGHQRFDDVLSSRCGCEPGPPAEEGGGGSVCLGDGTGLIRSKALKYAGKGRFPGDFQAPADMGGISVQFWTPAPAA